MISILLIHLEVKVALSIRKTRQIFQDRTILLGKLDFLPCFHLPVAKEGAL